MPAFARPAGSWRIRHLRACARRPFWCQSRRLAILRDSRFLNVSNVRRRGTGALQRWRVPCEFRLLWRAAGPCRLHAQTAAAFFTASHFAAPRDQRPPALARSLQLPPPLEGGSPLPPSCTNGRRVLYRVTLCGAEGPAPSSAGAFLANSASFGGRQALAAFMHKWPPRSLPRHTSRRRGTGALQRWRFPCEFRLLCWAAFPCRLYAQMAAAFFTASHFVAPRARRPPALALSLRIPSPLVGGSPLPAFWPTSSSRPVRPRRCVHPW
jgi:hypothetical protein